MTKEEILKKHYELVFISPDYEESINKGLNQKYVLPAMDEWAGIRREGLINVLRLIEVELLDIGLKKPLRAFYSIEYSLKLIRAALEQIDSKQIDQP